MPGRGLHHPRHRHRDQRRVAALVAGIGLLLVGSVGAAWSPTGTGDARAQGRVMPGGNTPMATVPFLSTSVTVSWSASTFAGGGAVPGYVVKRYPGGGGAPVTPANGCSGTITATSCTESGVPVGSWRYSVTPRAGGWSGAESGQSTAVTVPGT